MQQEIKSYISKKKLWEFFPLEKNYKIHFLAQGEYNKNYVLEDEKRKYVFRVNFGSQISVPSQIDYEFMTLKTLANSDITPIAFFVDSSKEILNNGILVMEYLQGRPLDYSSDLEKAAKIFAKIHSLLVDKNKQKDFIWEQNIFSDRIKESENLLASVWNNPSLGVEIKKIFEKLLIKLEKKKYQEKYFQQDPHYCINNTEVNSHNFIIGTEKSYLVDWEKAVISDPCQDLSHFLAPTTTLWKANYYLSKEEKNSFIKCYLKNHSRWGDKNIPQRLQLYNPYLYLRALSWCAFAYVDYQQRKITNQDTYQKIKQYLEVSFLKKLLKDWLD